MLDEKIMRVIPEVLFLFCLLEIFELGLTINDMNKAEKLEVELIQNLRALEKIANLLNDHLNGMVAEHYKKERQCNSM